MLLLYSLNSFLFFESISDANVPLLYDISGSWFSKDTYRYQGINCRYLRNLYSLNFIAIFTFAIVNMFVDSKVSEENFVSVQD